MKESKGGEKKQRECHVDVVDDCTVIGSSTPPYPLHLALQSLGNRRHSTRGSYHLNIRPQNATVKEVVRCYCAYAE